MLLSLNNLLCDYKVVIFTKHRLGEKAYIFFSYNIDWLMNIEHSFTLQLSKNINRFQITVFLKMVSIDGWYKVPIFAPEPYSHIHMHTLSLRTFCTLFFKSLFLCQSLSQSVHLMCNFQVCMSHCVLEQIHTQTVPVLAHLCCLTTTFDSQEHFKQSFYDLHIFKSSL